MATKFVLLLGAALFQAPQSISAAPQRGTHPSTAAHLVRSDRITVEVIGKGPDVVLIPGLASSREVWRRTADRLSSRYRFHIVQVNGFAGEPARANASGAVLQPVLAALASYISTAKLDRPAIVGHSLGGLMALSLAADHPQSVGKLFVVDALPFYAEIFAGPSATADGARPIAAALGAKMLGMTDAEFAASAAQTAVIMVTSKEDQARVASWSTTSDRHTMVTAMQEDLTTDLRPRIAGIQAPVTVLYEAPLKPLIDQDYAKLKHGTLIAAPAGAKHFIMFDDPAGFDKAMDAFLAS